MAEQSRTRYVLWFGALVLSLVGTIGYALGFERFDEWTLARPLFYFVIGFGMLGVVFLAPTWRTPKREIILLLGLALALRVALLPTPPSDDIHRYLWEGKLVAEGISPYALRGDSPELASHRDEQWELMNNKDKLTAYSPGSLLLFSAINAVSYSTWSFKIGFLLVDMLVVGLLMLSLRHRMLPLRHVGLYAFNPVVLVAFAGEAHFDVLMLAGLVACSVFIDRKTWIWAGCALAIATQMKVVALIGLPFLLWNGRWKAGIGFLVATIAISLPFVGSLPQLIEGVQQFGANRDFNGFPNLFGNALGLSRESIYRPLQILFVLCAIGRWIQYRGRDDWNSHWLYLCGALLLLSPTVHFWYFTWIAVAMVFVPSLFWVALTITQGIYFFVWKYYSETGIWDITDFHSALLWSPVFILGIPYAVRFIQGLRQKKVEAGGVGDKDDSLLVIIPTLNAAETLEFCIDQIVLQLRPQDTIVIADAHSVDETQAIAERETIAYVSADEGRGNQIAAGLAHTSSRYALIVHADTGLAEGSLEVLVEHMKRNPHCVGGSLGQRFVAHGLLPYRLVEFLNEFRSTLWGISFGDQCQFFDRTRLPQIRFPDQPLMEDVELSLRLQALGTTSYLGIESSSDPRKWKRKAPLRFALVIRLVTMYYLQRVLGEKRSAKYSAKLYRLYYNKEAVVDS